MKTELKQRMNKVSARSLDGNVVMDMAEWNAIVNLVSNMLSQEAEPVAWIDLSKMTPSGMVYATGFKANDRQTALYASPPKPAPLPQPALQCVPKKEWNQVTGRDGRMYTDGWNDCADYANKTSVIDEINVAVTQPVASVPQDEWTFDELDLRGPGDFMTAPPEGWESSDWRTCLELKAEMHNKKVYRAEIKRLRALIANKDSAKSGPQDVEEFICEKSNSYVLSHDLRDWMAGHARVPVDILGISEFALRRLQFDTPKNGTDYELITRALNAMLTASKERRE